MLKIKGSEWILKCFFITENGIINKGESVIKKFAGLITTIKPIKKPIKRMVFNLGLCL